MKLIHVLLIVAAQGWFVGAQAAERVPTTLSFDGAETVSSVATADPYADFAVRTLDFRAAGDGVFTLTLNGDLPASRPQPTTAAADGPALNLRRLSVPAWRSGRNVVINYDFSASGALADLSGGAEVVEGRLVVQPNTSNPEKKLFGLAWFEREFSFPLRVTVGMASRDPVSVGIGYRSNLKRWVWIDATTRGNAAMITVMYDNDGKLMPLTRSPINAKGPTRVSIQAKEAVPAANTPVRVRLSSPPEQPIALRTMRFEGPIRGLFGVQLDMDAVGVAIIKGTLDGPAGEAGVRPGDEILAIDGRAIKSGAEATSALGSIAPGSESIWTVRRGGKTSKVSITAG